MSVAYWASIHTDVDETLLSFLIIQYVLKNQDYAT